MVTIRVNIQEAKTHLSRYLDQVEQGDTLVLCRHNCPIAEIKAIVPHSIRPSRVAGLLKDSILWGPDTFAPMTETELADFDPPPLVPPTGPA